EVFYLMVHSPVGRNGQSCAYLKPGARSGDMEEWHTRFRAFSGSDCSDPIQDLRTLVELCHRWLRPDLHTKEQIMDLLVLEQFMISMPQDLQVLVKESGVRSCRQLEAVLRRHREPKQWVSETSTLGKGWGGAGAARCLQTRVLLLGCLSQGEEALPAIVPASRDPQGLSPKPDFQEEDVRADRQEATAVEPAELYLPEGPGESDFGCAEDGESPQEELPVENTHADPSSTPVLEGEASTPRPRHSRKRRNSSPTSSREQGGATQSESGEIPRQVGVNPSDAPSATKPVSSARQNAALYQCSDCPKSFNYRSQFVIHQRTHTGERPYQCESCKKGFMQASDLRVHQRIHSGEKPYMCEVCSHRFTHEASLLTHRRIHTNERPYKCQYCDKCFSHKGNLNVHQRIHTNTKPYRCDTCGHTFRQLGTFKRHTKIHLKAESQESGLGPQSQ
uniref:Zinc finger and SCAN domain containing 5B n=1 Tax=Oryctolagus cuniculus TaxID=9986 RepID=G1TTE6_RABIT